MLMLMTTTTIKTMMIMLTMMTTTTPMINTSLWNDRLDFLVEVRDTLLASKGEHFKEYSISTRLHKNNHRYFFLY